MSPLGASQENCEWTWLSGSLTFRSIQHAAAPDEDGLRNAPLQRVPRQPAAGASDLAGGAAVDVEDLPVDEA
jgi:hypothetical protein